MTVREAMRPAAVTVGSGHTLREAALRMHRGHVGAAVVLSPEQPAPAIITERDILRAVGYGLDVDEELVGTHLTADVVYSLPEWPVESAASQMAIGGFRHVIVMEGPEVVGILSMRDIFSHWFEVGFAPAAYTGALTAT